METRPWQGGRRGHFPTFLPLPLPLTLKTLATKLRYLSYQPTPLKRRRQQLPLRLSGLRGSELPPHVAVGSSFTVAVGSLISLATCPVRPCSRRSLWLLRLNLPAASTSQVRSSTAVQRMLGAPLLQQYYDSVHEFWMSSILFRTPMFSTKYAA